MVQVLFIVRKTYYVCSIEYGPVSKYQYLKIKLKTFTLFRKTNIFKIIENFKIITNIYLEIENSYYFVSIYTMQYTTILKIHLPSQRFSIVSSNKKLTIKLS